MNIADTFLTLALSVVLGLLVGMQRERTDRSVAGVRTFALLTLFGTVSALLAQFVGYWLVGVGLGGVIMFAALGHALAVERGERSPGITTPVAIVLMFVVGASLEYLPRTIPAALTGAIVLLLQFKVRLRGFATRLSEDDVRAIMQFVLVSLIILPIVPNESYGPYQALNPHEIWRMVVLVVGMSVAAYITYRFVGERASIIVGGLLGGMVSSTAATVSSSRAARRTGVFDAAAVIVLIAGSVVYPRVIIEISAVAPSLISSAYPPVLILFGTAIAVSLISFAMTRPETQPPAEHSNPSELKSALLFGALYAGVQLAVAFGRDYFGNQGMYVVAAISGLTDMDAITLSTSKLAQSGSLSHDLAWRSIVIASMSNVIFKSALVAALGGSRLFVRVMPYFGAKLAVAAGLLVFWPN